MIFFFLFICSCTQQISGVKEPHQRWCSPSWGSSRVKDSSRQSCKNDRAGSRTHALIRWFEFKQVYLLREDVRVSIASRFTQLTYLFTIQMSLLSHFKPTFLKRLVLIKFHYHSCKHRFYCWSLFSWIWISLEIRMKHERAYFRYLNIQV